MEQLSQKDLDEIFEKFTLQTTLPFVCLYAVRQPCTVFSSKLGGIPYLPKGFTYPTDSTDGEPLRLLAQLNFAQLPPLPGFPTEGILQFFIKQDDVCGLNFDNPTEQSSFHIVYHSQIVQDETLLCHTIPFIPEKEWEEFPFRGEFLLRGEAASAPLSPRDFRFDATYLDIYKQYKQTTAKRVYDLNSKLSDTLIDLIDSTGHHMGGYPFFTQEDPRCGKESLCDHTVLLLQIDSEGDGDDEIIWGDCGVANFFITPQDLAKLDFSNVIYNWDCF